MKVFSILNSQQVVLVFFSVLILQGCIDVEVENYFLPTNFEGNVAIIYTTGGAVQKGQQDWKIPPDGILKTPYQFRKGNFIMNYYQLNSKGKYDTLYDLGPSDLPDSNKNSIVFHRTLSFTSHKSESVVDVTTFYVGRKTASELSKDRFFFERSLEKLLLNR